MKKFFLLIITLAYFISTSGATIYLHQCMGKVVAWDFHGAKEAKCDNCGMDKNAPNDCCKDEVKVLKVKSDQLLPTTFAKCLLFSDYALPVSFFTEKKPVLTIVFPENTQYNSHLRSSNDNYCTLYCTFLI